MVTDELLKEGKGGCYCFLDCIEDGNVSWDGPYYSSSKIKEVTKKNNRAFYKRMNPGRGGYGFADPAVSCAQGSYYD